jgi:hypothetical protein
LAHCIGHFKGKKQFGIGLCQWTSGNVYEGIFENNVRNGFGIYTFSQDSSDELDKYEGMWRRATKHGNGTLFWRNGMKYAGRFIKNRREGFGKLIFAEDDEFQRVSYVGDFRKEKPSGQGTLLWKSNARYEGSFENGQIRGHGEYYYPTTNDKSKEQLQEGKFNVENGSLMLKENGELEILPVSE